MMRRKRERGRGQALAEFAIVAPLFFMMLLGTIDLGRVIWANDVLSNAAREGARFATVNGTTVVPPADPYNPAATTATVKTAIRDRVLSYDFAGTQGVSVTVCYSALGSTCSGNTDNPPTADRGRGAFVTVTVSGTIPLLTGSLIGLGDFAVNSTTTMLVSN